MKALVIITPACFFTFGIHSLTKSYDISGQRASYVTKLKQFIKNEVKVDNDVPDSKDKVERINELALIAEDLDILITDQFYLKMAKSFSE